LKNIFVGNLDFGATEDTVRSLFEAYGTVERVSLMTDRETGRSRGFAFVEMTDTEEADRAITALNGANVGGRALNVNEARPKPAGGGCSPGCRARPGATSRTSRAAREAQLHRRHQRRLRVRGGQGVKQPGNSRHRDRETGAVERGRLCPEDQVDADRSGR